MNDYLRLFSSSESGIKLYKKVRKMLYRDGRFVFVAAMPKTGSSFLARALCEATAYRHSYCAFDYANIEQELYLPRLVDNYGRGSVVQQHVRANEPNLILFREFGIRPIVIVRNLFDLVMSIRDHMLKERLDSMPGIYPSSGFAALPEERKLDFIVDFVMPWYVGYFASWKAAEKSGALDFKWLVYEEMIQDWPGTIRQVLDHQGLACPEAKVIQIVDALRTGGSSLVRLNKGVAGRGTAALTDRQKESIVRLAAHYPELDFSPVGIG